MLFYCEAQKALGNWINYRGKHNYTSGTGEIIRGTPNSTGEYKKYFGESFPALVSTKNNLRGTYLLRWA